jgi:hypothetical protein
MARKMDNGFKGDKPKGGLSNFEDNQSLLIKKGTTVISLILIFCS